MSKPFNQLNEREILALAITLEEEDSRTYGDMADALRDNYPASAKVFEAMRAEERRLAELVAGMSKLPQVLINVPVTGRAKPVLELAAVKAAAAEVEESLRGRGRLLLRASGTEPLIRVMVEGQDEQETRAAAARLAGVVRESAAAQTAASN